MKKLSAVLVGMVLLGALAAEASAQGYPGTYGTWNVPRPSFQGPISRYAGNYAACGDLPNAFSVYIGWLEHPRGSTWSLQGPERTAIAAWPLKGCWLGASWDVTWNNVFGLIFSGSVFFPNRSAGAWYTEPFSRTYDFEIPQYDWLTLDGLAKVRVYGSLEVLGGFRWDRVSTRVRFSDNTDDDYILNVYVPLMGVQVQQPISKASLLVRFVGSPLVGGRLKYHYWDNVGSAEFATFDASNGSFMEFFTNYSVKIRGRLSLGAFVKWDYLHVKTEVKRLRGTTTDPISWNVNTQWWTAGGSLTLAFFSLF